MPFSRWAMAFADETGRSSATSAAMATVASLANLDERTLVQEAQLGNRAAFEELVRRYDRDVLRLALNLMKRTEDARNLVPADEPGYAKLACGQCLYRRRLP